MLEYENWYNVTDILKQFDSFFGEKKLTVLVQKGTKSAQLIDNYYFKKWMNNKIFIWGELLIYKQKTLRKIICKYKKNDSALNHNTQS